jgi:hypothetical protein
MVASINKKGVGSFTLPGLLKVTAVAVPAKKARKGSSDDVPRDSRSQT